MSTFRTKKLKSVSRRHAIDMLLLGLPFGLIILAATAGYIPDEWMVWTFAILAPLGIFGFWRQSRRFSRLSCPDCETLLFASEYLPGTPLAFKCEECLIIWETGFTYPED